MQNLINKYNISESFYRRYFRYNAEMAYAAKLQEFILFRRGKFINPKNKTQYIDDITVQEIQNFYEKNEVNISKIDFDITSRCTLKCKNCSNLMPLFNSSNHIDLTFDDFKRDFDNLINSIDKIRILDILGGEPLLNKDLPKMIEHCAKNEKVDIIKIITNATIIPSEELIETIKKYNNKVYFYVSNYSVNEELKKRLKYEKIEKILKENDIKVQVMKDFVWYKEEELFNRDYSEAQVKNIFKYCMMSSCLSVFNHNLHICPKSASGHELGLFKSNDCIDLTEQINLKQKIIEFYQKDYFEACKYCVRSEEEVIPAEQL